MKTDFQQAESNYNWANHEHGINNHEAIKYFARALPLYRQCIIDDTDPDHSGISLLETGMCHLRIKQPGYKKTARDYFTVAVVNNNRFGWTQLVELETVEEANHQITPDPYRQRCFLRLAKHFVDTNQCKMGSLETVATRASLGHVLADNTPPNEADRLWGMVALFWSLRHQQQSQTNIQPICVTSVNSFWLLFSLYWR